MTAFGYFPRTRIRDGEPGSWTGRNGLFSGIEVCRVANLAGVWAQEYWEWRLRALWAVVSAAALTGGTVGAYALNSWIPMFIGLLGFGLGFVMNLGHAAHREIYSHAITFEAAQMLGLPCSEVEMVSSLASYWYCDGISRDKLLLRLRAERPEARAWCEKHRQIIEKVDQLMRKACFP